MSTATVRVRFSCRTGECLRPAKIVGQYKGLPLLRVLMLDTGTHAHVHPTSIVRSA